MKNNLNTKKSPENISEIIKNINKEIFDEKIWIWENMWKIAEVTYSYTEKDKKNNKKIFIKWKEVFINFTLFCEIWWLDLENFDSFYDSEKIEKILIAKENLIKKIDEKIDKINIFQKNILDFSEKNEEEKIKKEIIFDCLDEKKSLLEYCKIWLPYELEKAWIELKLDKKDFFEIDKNLKKIDKDIFWWQVSENPFEINLCLKNLSEEFLENMENLDEKEQKEYKYFLEKIEKKFKNEILEENTFKNIKRNFEKQKTNKLEKYENIKIKDSDYMDFFNIFLEENEIKIKAVQNSEAWSISDGPWKIEFPKNKEFENLTLKRILTLNSHEIETHSLREKNNFKIIWNIRWKNSTKTDEGLAILMENLLEYWENLFIEKNWKKIIDINKWKISPNLALTLVWEISEDDELKKFLDLRYKMWLWKIDVKERFYRLKRSNKAWVQHKDTSYTRWYFEIVNFLNKWEIDFRDLFLWKFCIEDLKKIKKINKDENILPKFNSQKIVYFLENENFSEENFLKYLKENILFHDFKKLEVEKTKEENKQKIWKIFWEKKEDKILKIAKKIKDLINN